MAILFNDPFGGGQEEVKLGSSRITPRETYSSSASGINAQYSDQIRNVDSLVSALSGLSRAAGQYEAQRQAMVDDTLERTKDLVDGVKSDDAVGAFSSAANGVIASGASPRMQNRLQQYYGMEAARSYLATNKDLQAILIDENLKAYPAEFEKRIEGFVSTSIEELRKRNPNLLFAGGAAQFIRNFANNAKSSSFEFANEQARLELRRAGVIADRESIPQSATFSRVETVLAELNGDAAEARQVLAIENPNMNTRAISPERSSNAAAGLFQIKPNTFAEIAQYPEARQYNLNNPMDERQNAIAYQLYWNRLKKQAQGILGPEPKTAETYLLYNLGPGAGGSALKAYAAGRDAPISEFASEAAIRGNPKLYSANSTVGGALNRINSLMKSGSDFHAPITPLSSRQRVDLTEDNFSARNYSWGDFKNSGTYGGRGQIDSRIVNILDDVTDQFGRKLRISSAHRDQAYDASVGGKGNHPHGDAIDIDTSGMSNDEKKKLVALFVANGVRGIGTYASGNSIHVDLGVGREKAGRQGGDLQSWNRAGHSWFNEGIASGKEMGGAGYVRRPGFQNTPFNSTEARIKNLRENYGYSPSEARATVLRETQNFALNQAHAGQAPDALLTAEALRTNLKLTPTEELAINNTLRTVETIQDQAYKARIERELREAEDYRAQGIREAIQAEKEGRLYRPDPDKMPQTVAGRKAHADLESIGLNPIPISADRSKENLMLLTSRLDDPELYKELGFEDGQRPRNATEALEAVQRRKGRDLTPDDRLKLVEDIEKRRIEGPVSERLAKASTTENRPFLHAMFTSNQALVTELAMRASADQSSLTEKLAPMNDLLERIYSDNYAVLYMNRMSRLPLGAELSAEDRKEVETLALRNVREWANGYANAVLALKPDNKRKPEEEAALRMQASGYVDPRSITEALLTAARSAAAVDIPSVPRGSRVISYDADSNIFRMVTPDGRPFFYSPASEASTVSPSFRGKMEDADRRDEAQAARGRVGSQTQNSSSAAPLAPTNTTPAQQAQAAREKVAGQQASTFAQQVQETENNAVERTVRGALESFINSRPEVRAFDREMMSAKTKAEELAIGQRKEAAIKALNEQYSQQFAQAYEMFKQARNALDAAPPGQRAAARKMYNAAKAAWDELNK